VFRLNREALVSRLRRLAQDLLDARSEVQQVRLFGSLARGTAAPGSDADILIVLADSSRSFVDRIGEYGRFLSGTGLACDVLAYTEHELARLRQDGNAFIHTAWDEGIVLAERVPAG
jgi:predicted nucleotidyltransferase